MLQASIYSPFVKDWLSVWGDRMKVIRSEDYYNDRINVLQDVAKFLELGKFNLIVLY